MAAPADPDLAGRNYAFPERLVSADWLSSRLGTSGLVIIEADEDTFLYDIGHIPGAIKIDWTADLNTFPMRDYITREQFSVLMNQKGINRDDTVVIYGDKSNWWAAYTLWIFTLFGHPDVRLLDGGRDLWVSSGREMVFDVPNRVTTGYPTGKRHDSTIRAYRDDVLHALGNHPLIDVRSTEEYVGEQEPRNHTASKNLSRTGHIPTALSIPWDKVLTDDGQFRSYTELQKIYGFLTSSDHPIVYCHMGARSSHTWFVLTYLLGLSGVRHYDGSWIEWGNTVQVPIAKGLEPGAAPPIVHP